MVYDLDDYSWPFKSESVIDVVAEHCLEHLIDHNRTMKEIHRRLVKGGQAKLKIPHFTW